MTSGASPSRGAAVRGIAALCIVMLTSSACQQMGNVERIRFGREYTSDGERLRVASLQPRCGCVSVANTAKHAIWLESWFYAIPRGGEVLQPGDRRRVMFDWAGPANSDFYELVAFKTAVKDGVEGKDTSSTGGLRLRDVAVEYNQLAQVACDDSSCQFGPLAMNRVFGATAVQGQEGAASPPGVNFSSVIEAAAPLENRCGCMLMENSDPDHAITLRASLHGAETGQLTLEPRQTARVPFDWAGDLDSDVYVIDAVALEARTTKLGTQTAGRSAAPQGPGMPREGTAPIATAGGTQSTAMTIRLRNYITIQGQLLEMSCTPEYAVFPLRPDNPTGGTAAIASTPDSPPSATGFTTEDIRCPWSPGGRPGLGMYSAYNPTRTVASATVPASRPAAPVPPSAAPPAQGARPPVTAPVR